MNKNSLQTSIVTNTTPSSSGYCGYLGTTITTGSLVNSVVINGDWKSDITDFCELVLSALGHDDIKYVDFCEMSSSERSSLLRDIKIKRVLG